MYIKYDIGRTSASSQEFLDRMEKLYQEQKQIEEQNYKINYLETIRGVHLPKLSTIETYDELIKYVEELYVNGMILGDEFVMKPSIDQRRKLINSTTMSLIGSEYPSVDIMGGFNIQTSFGVKIIIK